MMLMKFGGLRGTSDACASMSPSSMSIGDACTLPDGSNIGVWNGSHLVAPDGSNLDAINAATLTASGNWTSAQVTGAQGSGTSTSSWWSGALTSLTKGVVGGLVNPTPTALPPCNAVAPGTPCMPVVETPWYQTPLGIGGIIAALGLAYFIFKK
jgi:hypothetical protein